MKDASIEIRIECLLGAFTLELDLELVGSRVGLFGPSGAGKTTLLEIVAGWRRPRSGRVVVGGRVLLDLDSGVDLPARERGIGYVPQDGLLFPHFDVMANLTAARRGARDSATLERVVEVLELAPLIERPIEGLSGGERQRVALGRALCSQPTLLLFDEPLGALDQPLRRRILPYLARIGEEFDVPMLFVSHDATEVLVLCDEVVVLDHGRAVDQGLPAAVLARPSLGGPAFENVLTGEVVRSGEGTADVRIAAGIEVRIALHGTAAGERASFGLRADEILLSLERPVGISARNLLPARVLEVTREGDDVILSAAPLGAGVDGPPLLVSLTPGALRELDLAPGREVHLVFKTQSCRRLA